MISTVKNHDTSGSGGWLAAFMIATFAVAVLVAGIAQAQTLAPPVRPAPPAPTGLPGEQNAPGSEQLAAGRAAAARGNWEAALDNFRIVLDQHANGPLADDATFWSAYCLNQLGEYERAVDTATRLLDDFPRSDLRQDARAVRIEAAEALVQRGNTSYERYLREEVAPPAPPASPQGAGVPQASDAPPPPDPEAELRLMALDALIGMDPEQAFPLVQRLAEESTDPEIRSRIMWLLAEVGTDEAFDMLVDMARNDTDAEVRSQALFWLSQSEGHADQAVDLLIEMINSGEAEAIGLAMFGLGQIDDPRAYEAIASLARDTTKSTGIRGQALFWLGRSDAGQRLALLRDVALSDSDMELRSQALFGISQIQSQEAADLLLEIARSDGPMEFRSSAIFFLSQRQDDRIVDVLIDMWNEADDPEVRGQLMFALAQTESEQAIDHMIAIAIDKDEDPEVRQQAVFWLGQVDHPKAKQALIDIIGDIGLEEVIR